MTYEGWLVMILSVGSTSLLLGWSIWRVITTPGETEHMHTPLDIDTGDTQD